MFDKIKHYFLETLWNFSLSGKKGKSRFFLKTLRIAFLSLRGFIEDQCSLRASSLTYYTIMSIVPVFALAFAVTRGFGYYQNFRVQIFTQFPEHQIIVTELFRYADILLEQTRGGIVASFGLIFLVFTVILLLSSLEGVLNHIWGVKKLRTWWRIFTDYLAFMLLAPLFFIIANTFAVVVTEVSSEFIRMLPFSQMAIRWILFLVHLLPYCLFWILFTFIYFFMPNTKVQFRSALLAGVLAGSCYLILQWGYIHFLVGVSRYGAIYGSMAAIPLFLVWLQLSWALFLFGAELSYAHQTLEEHEYEKPIGRVSVHLKRLVSLWISYLAIQKGFLTIEDLAREEHIPKRLSKLLLRELVEAQILEMEKDRYVPAKKTSEMRISELLNAHETRGVNRFPFIDSKAFTTFEETLDEFQKTIQSHPQNMRLKDVPHPL